MPNHTASRQRVCAVCWNRGGKKIERIIGAGSQIELGIIEFIDRDYRVSDMRTPCGICWDCLRGGKKVRFYRAGKNRGGKITAF